MPSASSSAAVSGEKIVTIPVSSMSILVPVVVLDAADHLAAGPDDVADPIGLDRDHLHPRRIARQLRPRLEVDEVGGCLLLHAVEDVQASHPCLLERALEHLPVDAADLDVHLQRGDARRACR